ncbi:unnamed protein product [Linum tenue]|uniref:Uncharacterized protein n=1 Tax=Linum tenue TaxID=586396 RepID=A0AAV0J3M5_9ROSI|nr:unnamed protein product [Linum tenue]
MFLRRPGNYLTYWIRYTILLMLKSRAHSISQPSVPTHKPTSPALGSTYSLYPSRWSHLPRAFQIVIPTMTKPSSLQPNGCSRYATFILYVWLMPTLFRKLLLIQGSFAFAGCRGGDCSLHRAVERNSIYN